MKKQLYTFIFFSAFCFFSFKTFGQACSAVWNLTSSNTPTITGLISGSTESTGSPSFGSGVSSQGTLNSPNYGIWGQGWSSSSTTPVPSSNTTYIQFSVAPTGGCNGLNINSININMYNNEGAPNDMMAIFWSTSSTFATSTAIVTGYSMPAGLVNYTYNSVTASCANGQTLYFRVYFYYASAGVSFGVKKLTLSGATSADNCACATDITSLFTSASTAALATSYSCSTTGGNMGATADQGNTTCFTNAQNVWYKFTPTVTGSYYVGVQGTGYVGTIYYPEVAVLSGSCGSFTTLGCSGVTSYTKKPYGFYDETYSPAYSYAGGCNLTAGTTYYIMVDNAHGTTDNGLFTLTVNTLSNDVASTAAILPSCGTNFYSSTIGATNCNNCTGSSTSANNDLDCNAATSVGSGSGSDVYTGMSVENDSWYVFCTTSAGTYSLTLSAVDATCIGPDALTSSELQCNIYIGNGANAYTALSWQYGDYFGDAWNENIAISLTANQCCWVEVDGFAGTNCDYYLYLSGACTLPVELIGFSGENADNGRIKLNWATASENKNSKYKIERSSDGFSFKELGELKATGTSSVKNSYYIYDEQPLDGNNYYRLSTIDINGKEDVASTIVVTHKAHLPNFSVFPNPAKEQLTVNLHNFSTSTVTIEIVDMFGRTAWSSDLVPDNGNLQEQIDLSSFSSGMYFVKAFDGNNFYTKNIYISKEN